MENLISIKCLVPKRTDYGKAIRKDYETHKLYEHRSNMVILAPRNDECINTLTTVLKDNYILEIYEKN